MSRRHVDQQRLAGLLACGLVSLVLSGCSSLAGPQAWEKGNLAKPQMSMGGDPLEQRYQQHINTSKEASSGGYGVGGGGCGCN